MGDNSAVEGIIQTPLRGGWDGYQCPAPPGGAGGGGGRWESLRQDWFGKQSNGGADCFEVEPLVTAGEKVNLIAVHVAFAGDLSRANKVAFAMARRQEGFHDRLGLRTPGVFLRQVGFAIRGRGVVTAAVDGTLNVVVGEGVQKGERRLQVAFAVRLHDAQFAFDGAGLVSKVEGGIVGGFGANEVHGQILRLWVRMIRETMHASPCLALGRGGHGSNQTTARIDVNLPSITE